MTENEAIKFIGQAVIESKKAIEELRNIKTKAERVGKIGEYYANLDNCIKEIESCKVAIQALEEIQQYRAIGTVEGYERAIQSSIENYNLYREYKAKVQESEAIGTIEEFKALKEKSVAKKPIRSDLCTCPSCGTHNEIIKKRRNTVTFDTVYCWHCGQAIEIKCD